MQSQIIEWTIVFSFFFLALAATLLEAFVLSKKGWTNFSKGLLFAFLTNTLSFVVCFIVLFIVFGVVLALAWEGSISKFPGGDYGVGAVLILAGLFVPLFSTLCKWLFLKMLKIQSGQPAFVFSLLSSVASILVAVGAPVLLSYILYKVVK